jgi:hypothetical protein
MELHKMNYTESKFRELDEVLSTALKNGTSSEAETRFLDERRDAVQRSDRDTLLFVDQLLVHLFSGARIPDVAKAEKYAREREQHEGSAYGKLQTAMILYIVKHDPKAAAAKAEEAINVGRLNNDDVTVYSALAVRGQALLDLSEFDAAREVIGEIDVMLDRKKDVRSADATVLLEKASALRLDSHRVKIIARKIDELTSDIHFKSRLERIHRA